MFARYWLGDLSQSQSPYLAQPSRPLRPRSLNGPPSWPRWNDGSSRREACARIGDQCGKVAFRSAKGKGEPLARWFSASPGAAVPFAERKATMPPIRAQARSLRRTRYGSTDEINLEENKRHRARRRRRPMRPDERVND